MPRACGILVPWPRTEPGQLECRVLITGEPWSPLFLWFKPLLIPKISIEVRPTNAYTKFFVNYVCVCNKEKNWNLYVIYPILLKSSTVFPILLFPSVSFQCSFKKASLSLLAVLCNSAFSWVYLSLHPCLWLFFFSQEFIKTSQTTSLPSCITFFLGGLVLLTASCTMLWTSIHSFSGTLSTRCNTLNLFITSTV